MYDLKITDGDIVLDSTCKPGNLPVQESVEQIVNHTLSLWEGEYFRDSSRGVKWLTIFQKQYNRQQIIQELSRALLKSVYVSRIIDISLRVENRTATVYLTVVASGENVTLELEV